MSFDNGGVVRGSQYCNHDCTKFGHYKTKADTTTDLGDECIDYTVKKPTSASSVSLKQTSTPSPSYPSANSWPGFGSRYAHSEEIQVPTVDSIKSPCDAKCDLTVRRQKPGKRVYVFSSKMANDAAIGVRQKKYESIIAWHEANCRPSTSKCEFTNDCQAAPILKKKRCSLQDYRNGSPMKSCGTPSVCSPSSTMLPTPSQISGESSGNPPSNPSETFSGELLNPDDHADMGDNPLRRMERMTQDSLFEPHSKLCRTSTDNSQPARREQDRNAKLEKMRTLEQQIMYDKAKTEWDRMMHEHETVRMTRNHMPPLIPLCSSQVSVPAPYPCAFASQNGILMQGACRRPMYPQTLQSTQPSSSVSNISINTPMMVSLPQTSGPNMPMSQPLRPSLNPSGCIMHYSQCGFMCCPYPSSTYPTPQGYSHVNDTVSPCFPSGFASNNGNIAPQPRDNGIYQRGIRAVCSSEKMECEMWNRQIPAVPTDFTDTFSDQKLQYHPSGAVDGKLLDVVPSTNPMFA